MNTDQNEPKPEYKGSLEETFDMMFFQGEFEGTEPTQERLDEIAAESKTKAERDLLEMEWWLNHPSA